MASIMFFTVSIICLALIVCCSNLVFTADCEIHSCEEPKPQHITAIPYQHLLEFHCQKALAAISMNLNPWETKRENIQKSKDNRKGISNESTAAGLYLHTFTFSDSNVQRFFCLQQMSNGNKNQTLCLCQINPALKKTLPAAYWEHWMSNVTPGNTASHELFLLQLIFTASSSSSVSVKCYKLMSILTVQAQTI